MDQSNFHKTCEVFYFVMFRDIQQKKRIIAEKIETVTVFYSDLVNFSELYTDSSPFEVGQGSISLYS